MRKSFKFWKWILELRLKKFSDRDKVEFLANELLKQVISNIDPKCDCLTIWVHNKESIDIEQSSNHDFESATYKYTTNKIGGDKDGRTNSNSGNK